MLAVFFLIFALPILAVVQEVGPIGLTVSNLNQELNFFTNTLPFELVSISETSGRESDGLLGLNATKLRTATLQLGDERITLTEHLGKKGRPVPQDSRSFDHWFQHIAIVVSDMDEAYARLLEHKVTHVSTAPQTLPEWNKDAGGIKAFYFRDPEDHVLEIIWFPPGKGNPKWQRSRRGDEAEERESASSRRRLLFLGIDHTAIVVSDTDKSLAFYRDLGFKVVGGAHNYGTEQEHLNQVFGARLYITALRAEHGPGIEFLEYITPPGGRPLPANAKSNDLLFWHTDLVADGFNDVVRRLREQGTRFVSTRLPDFSGNHMDPLKAVIVRDPDGHALEIMNHIAPTPGTLVNSSNRAGNP